MNWWIVSIEQIREKKLTNALSVVLMSFGVGIILMMLNISQQIDQTFKNNIKGIDMVVGAKGSPLQIILSSVYHMDAPTGNISSNDAQLIAKNGLVKSAIPLSFGDSYKGYKILGTTQSFFDLYDAQIAEGKLFSNSLEVVLGNSLAQKLKLSVGDEFFGNHGLQEQSTITHDHHGYTVVGILDLNNSVLDQLILTSLNSVWDVHSHHEHSDHTPIITDISQLKDEQEITSILLQFKSKMATFSLPNLINKQTNAQAALPSIEVSRLLGLLGVGVETLTYLAILITLISALSVFVSLYSNLKNQDYILALIRSFGASRLILFRVVIQQGIILAIIGYAFGFVFSKMGIWFINDYANSHYHLTGGFGTFSKSELYVFATTICIGLVSALIPAINAYRINISKVLRNA